MTCANIFCSFTFLIGVFLVSECMLIEFLVVSGGSVGSAGSVNFDLATERYGSGYKDFVVAESTGNHSRKSEVLRLTSPLHCEVSFCFCIVSSFLMSWSHRILERGYGGVTYRRSYSHRNFFTVPSLGLRRLTVAVPSFQNLM